jgi:hypothetical protein
MATGDLLSTDACSEVILFTLDEHILRPIAEHDEASGYYTKDLSAEWLRNLRKKIHHSRPTTADSVANNPSSSQTKATSSIKSVEEPRPITSTVFDDIPSIPVANLAERRHVPLISSIKEPEEELNIDDVISDLTNALSSNAETQAVQPLEVSSLSRLHKGATFSISSSSSSNSKPVDVKALALPLPLSVESSSSKLGTVTCRRLTINLLSTWGDPNYLGIAGLEILALVNDKVTIIDLSANHIEHVEPRDLSSIGIYDDPRVPENIFNGVANLADDRFMWLIPFTANSTHFIQFDLQQRYKLIGLRIWNYNRNDESILRGVKEMSIECDGQVLGHWMCHLATGYDGVMSSQMVYFNEILTPPPTVASIYNPSLNHDQAVPAHQPRYIRYITPALKQDYEPQMLPSGLLFCFTLFENHGDDYFIGLDKIDFFDQQGKHIDLQTCQATIHAWPSSLRDLGESYQHDDRVVENIIAGHPASPWLAPIPHSMTATERKAVILRNVRAKPPAKLYSKRLQQIYDTYYENLVSNEDSIDEQTIALPRENKLWIAFRYPVTISSIRLHNYSKTPVRGVKEFALHLDGNLLYMGSMQPATTPSSKPQAIVFNNDPKIVRAEKDFVQFCGSSEQDVLYINERQVMVRSKDMYTRKPSAAAEGVYVDVKNR